MIAYQAEEPKTMDDSLKWTHIQDRVTLEKRLAELAETPYEGDFVVITCYFPGGFRYAPAKYTCPDCGHETDQNSVIVKDIEAIRRAVSQMKKLGYDVVLDEHEFCGHCTHDKHPSRYALTVMEHPDKRDWKKAKNPELIFKFRINQEDSYHVVKSSRVSNYNCALEFLKGNETFKGTPNIQPIHDNIAIVKKCLA